MLPSSEIVIADTSCLILLSKINELELLKLPGRKVFVTSFISEEFGKKLPEWIQVSDPENRYYQKIIEMNLDKGEASAIALSLSNTNSILIIDDLKGRKTAEKLNLRYSGTLGLILRAKQEGLITEVKPVIRKIRMTNFRLHKELLKTVLKESGEG